MWLAALAALAVLAGCGGGGSSSPDDAGRSYRDVKGRTVTLPAHPARVVALSEPTLDAALALGVKPIATTMGRGQGTVSSYLQGDEARHLRMHTAKQSRHSWLVELERALLALRPSTQILSGQLLRAL